MFFNKTNAMFSKPRDFIAKSVFSESGLGHIASDLALMLQTFLCSFSICSQSARLAIVFRHSGRKAFLFHTKNCYVHELEVFDPINHTLFLPSLMKKGVREELANFHTNDSIISISQSRFLKDRCCHTSQFGFFSLVLRIMSYSCPRP